MISKSYFLAEALCPSQLSGSRVSFFQGFSRLVFFGVAVVPGPLAPWSCGPLVSRAVLCRHLRMLDVSKDANSHWNRNARGRVLRNCRHFWMQDVSEMPIVTRSRSSGLQLCTVTAVTFGRCLKSSCRQCASQFSSFLVTFRPRTWSWFCEFHVSGTSHQDPRGRTCETCRFCASQACQLSQT